MMTDETLRTLLTGSCSEPLADLVERENEWALSTLSVSKRQPWYSNGWSYSLWPESCFYKRWFNYPDLGKMGWAILLHIVDPTGDEVRAKWGTDTEQFPGWVPPERAADADRWIATLNDEIRKRLAEAASKS